MHHLVREYCTLISGQRLDSNGLNYFLRFCSNQCLLLKTYSYKPVKNAFEVRFWLIWTKVATRLFRLSPQSTGEAHVAFSVSVFIPITLSVLETVLMRSVSTLPRLSPIFEHHGIFVLSTGDNIIDSIGQFTCQPECLRFRIDRLFLNFSNHLLRSIVKNNVKGVAGTDTLLITLMLDDMHRAPAWSEA